MNLSKIIGIAAIIGMGVIIYNEYQKRKQQTKPVKIK